MLDIAGPVLDRNLKQETGISGSAMGGWGLHQTVGGFKTGYPATFPICLCQPSEP